MSCRRKRFSGNMQSGLKSGLKYFESSKFISFKVTRTPKCPKSYLKCWWKNATNFSQFLFLQSSFTSMGHQLWMLQYLRFNYVSINSHIDSSFYSCDVVLSLPLSMPGFFLSESHWIQSCQFFWQHVKSLEKAFKNGFASSHHVTRIRCGSLEILLYWVLFRRSKQTLSDSTKFSDTCCVALLRPSESSLNIHSCHQQKSQFNSLAKKKWTKQLYCVLATCASKRPPSKLVHLANGESSHFWAFQFNLWRNNRCKSKAEAVRHR